jgi:hypothetical protein
MKKHMISLVLVAAIIGSIAAGCSSQKNAAAGSDSTAVKDTTKVSTPATATPDTTKKDTMKKDTAKH